MSLSEVLNKAFETKGETPKKERSESMKFTCKKCDQSFDTVLKLANHVRVTHKKRKQQPARVPQNITLEARDNMIRFLKARTDIPSHAARYAEAVNQFAKGKLSDKSSSAVVRWFRYIGDKRYDPDLRDGTAAAPVETKSKYAHPPSKITDEQRNLITAFMQEHIQEYGTQVNCFAAACKAVGVTMAVNTHNASTYFNRKIKAPELPVVELSPVRNLNGDQFNGGKAPGRTTKEERSKLALFMAENSSDYPTQLAAMQAGIEKFGLTITANIGNASVYMNKGKEIIASRPKVVETITLLGQVFTAEQLEEIIRSARNAVKPPKHCPECGYSLVQHAHAYTVAQNLRKAVQD